MSEASCESCVGACCTANMYLRLTSEEAAFMRTGGTLLQPIYKADPEKDWSKEASHSPTGRESVYSVTEVLPTLTKGIGYYMLISDCAYLGEVDSTGMRRCTVFDSPQRPETCGDFPAGGQTCVRVRISRGVF